MVPRTQLTVSALLVGWDTGTRPCWQRALALHTRASKVCPKVGLILEAEVPWGWPEGLLQGQPRAELL